MRRETSEKARALLGGIETIERGIAQYQRAADEYTESDEPVPEGVRRILITHRARLKARLKELEQLKDE